MGPPPATIYVTQGSFPPAEAQIILAYIAEPSRYLGPMLVSVHASRARVDEPAVS